MTALIASGVEAEGPPAPRTAPLRALVIGTTVAVPLVFDPRQGQSGGHPKYVLLVVAALVGGALLVVDLVAGRQYRRSRNWLRIPVLVLVGSTAVSALASDHQATVLSGFPGSYDGFVTAVSLAVLFAAAVAAFRPGDIRPAVTALWFGGGGGVLAFGLAQFVDRVFFPGGWDWARPSVSPWTIGSTLGNPNHLASFLAVLLPIGLVLWILGDRRTRAAVAAAGVAAVVELGITTSRGGLVAAAAGLTVLAVLLRPEVARHRSSVVRATVALLAVGLVAAVASGAAGAAKRDPASVLEVGSGSTIDVRREVWATAWRVAVDHPVFGVGPDVFPVVFPEYESERFMLLFGPFTIANGAHNVFLNTLANQGAVGLLALLLLLATAAVHIGRRWRDLSVGDDRPNGQGWRQQRLLLAGVAAALVAYLVQATFNTQQIALSLTFWTLLAMAVVLCPPGRPEVVKEES